MTTTLSRIFLAGFRSIERMDIPLGRTTVLIGPNGAGKSNLLSFLQLVPRLRTQSLRLFVGQAGGSRSLLHQGVQRYSEIGFRLEATTGDGDHTAYVGTLGAAAGDTLVFLDERVEERRAGSFSFVGKALGSGHNESQLLPCSKNPAFRPASVVSDWVAQIGFFHFHDTSFMAPLRTNSRQEDDRALRADGGNLAAYLYRLATSSREVDQAAFARITSLVQRIAPFVKTLEPRLIAPELGPRSAVALFWTNVNDVPFAVHHFSDGTLRAIALFTALAQPADHLPAFIAIDEPELGLHPAALALFVSLVRSVADRCQVFLATQSPALLDHFRPEEVVVAEAPNGVSTFKRLDAAELETWLEDYRLSDLYDKNVLGGRP
ncbi:MAG: AAA family ATPase [Rhodoglobus sp.]